MALLFVFCLIQLLGFSFSDNVRPEFGKSIYIASNVKERSPIGTSVLNVTAVDADGDIVTYVLGGDAKSKFSINNKTGEIFVNAILTKKEYPNKIIFEVSAYDNINGENYKVTADIYVFLDDINDNTPYFVNEPYIKKVSEDADISDIVLQVTAKDDDTTAKYGLVSYIIDAGNEEGKFAIAPHAGHITVVDTLNFDKTNKYILNISATDGGGKADTTTVVIDILDYDNLPAIFDQRTYLATVQEDAPKGFHVIQVTARDGDTLNASVEYMIVPETDKNSKFSIDNTTGVITVNGSLDREVISSYLLRIGARSTYHTAVYATVSVQVLDKNDNGPVFEPNTYAAFLPENSPVDLTVLQVTATDSDLGENATLQYILWGADNKFDIRNSGHIVVKSNIDREEKFQYKFVVTAQETSTSERYESNATVVINITDVNDHNPKCSQEIYKATVDENRPNGTYVTQVVGIDSDAGKNAEVRFSFESDLDSHANLFAIDAVTGNITTLNSLDRETTSTFTLTVTLRDQAEVEHKRSGSCFVQVSVGDKNDNTPKFISLLNVTSVAEDARPGTTVVTIKAQDDDSSLNAQVKYNIASGNINDTFHLNISSGVLMTSKTLDRETINQYNLIVNATDNGGMSQTAVVIVAILDKNDNAPRFHQPHGYWFSVDENSAALLVGIVQASDDDLDSNADITYSIVLSLNSDKFAIESSTGTIKTAVPLDRETTDTYKLTLIASDKGSPPLSTNVTVYINVSDVNDNMPYFTKEHYTVSLDENDENHVFLNLTANDKDLGINSKLRYDILSGNSEGHFSVDSNTGTLSTKKMLDFETNHIFTLIVQVHDLDGNGSYGEPFQDNAVVYVSVQDVNDHAPTFIQPSYSSSFYENITIGSEVIIMRAVDEDSGQNKVIEYSFIRGNELGIFFMDMHSGRVTLKETIDRDPPNNQTTFNITVMAKDSGEPSLNSTVQLFIEVGDANDNVPEFSQARYTVDLQENSPVGTSLIQLHCKDVDSGQNGKFSFMIKSGIGKDDPEFHIDNVTGVLTSLVMIDYDVGTYDYRLVVEAIDKGEPQLLGSTIVTIIIVNSNDNSPQFKHQSYSFSINEGSYLGVHEPVGKVTAGDLDYDGKSPYGQVYYSISNKTSMFSVDNITGLITTNVILDREQNTNFVLKVEAKDGDNVKARSNFTWVYITLLDKNDNAPKFGKSRQTIHVLEDVPVGFSIVNITASDPDAGLNGEVFYSMLSGDIDSHFRFNNLTGEIKTNKDLDRETTARYFLVIQAQDKGTPSSNSLAICTIIVDDVNDNSPVITSTSYASNIGENLPPGQLVCKVTASDDDEGVNQAISFSLNYPEFTVNSSGYVYTTESLDREKIAEYDIQIVAADHGLSPKSSFVVVKVGVADTNDNFPVFSKEVYSVLVSENITVGSGVIQVMATDIDEGINSELTYSLSGGHGHFNINTTTGLISLATLVDHELNPGGFMVFVTASDRGIPGEKSSTVQVDIGLSDVNDNSPVFEKYGYAATVEEKSEPGTYVVRVEARDRDLGLLGEVAYAIVDGNTGDVFLVNNSGFITVSGKLDREVKEFYELSVKATDKAGIPKSAQVIVNIRILDLNDNAPRIHNVPVTLYVNETTSVGSVLFLVFASDLDLRKTNEKVTFVGLPGDGVMEVDSDTGEVLLVKSLDYAVNQKHVFRLFAADRGVPMLNSSTVNVTLVVIKKDSNVPMFSHPSYTFNITEDTTVDATIARLQASQRNSTPGSTIVYAITSGNSDGFFKIDQQGALMLTKIMDRERQPSYTFTVTATNSEVSSQVGYTVVTVLISDVNDSPPLFQYENYESEIIEDASPDTAVISVEAFDSDTELDTNFQYSIISGNEERKFKIETKSVVDGNNVGVISVAEALDREATEFYTMKLSVSDGEFHSNCTLRIKVKDINDNSPIFDQANYEASIAENTGAGATVLRVNAVDADIHENAEVTYSMTGGQDKFSIETISGEIKTTAQPTDVETQSSYSFQVTATDVDGKIGTTDVMIIVTDKNDNAPVFGESSYATEVTEGPDSNGKTIITVKATDLDSGRNKDIVYSINEGNIGGTFQIDNNTGVITAATVVDREIEGLSTNSQGYKMFALAIVATDQGNPPLSASIVIDIVVSDINDNIPMFPHHGYAFMISKDATADMVVVTVMATDKDDGENSRVTYEILEGNTGGDFSMETNTGVLRTAKNLDRAIGFQYNLTVKATDHGSLALSSTTTVSMTVGENNDHSPVLNPQNYTIDIYENNLANSVVLNVTATDADTKQNAEITYSIIAGDSRSIFTLETESYGGKLVVLGRLDRETLDQYVLEIEAKDGGIPVSRKTTGFIIVTILDLNDNAPEFTNNHYSGSLEENSGPDIVVQMTATVSASDKDTSINSAIIYSIDGPGSEQFLVDRTTAVIRTRSSPVPSLDYEKNSTYLFNIIATDQTGNGLSSSVPVSILLIDENDNTPVFLPSVLYVPIPESTPVNDVIATFAAFDSDPGMNGRVNYSIISGAEGMFAVGEADGKLRVVHELDREKNEVYHINISGIDGNLYPRQGFGIVVVTLVDLNDNAPIFDEPEYTASVSEDVSIGHEVATVRAVDLDKGINSIVIYSLHHPLFHVNNITGVVTTKAPLDRETAGSYSLSVHAVDGGGLETSVMVNILVDDVNDNSPYFPKNDQYRSDVSEDTPIAAAIVRIVAEDDDIGKNAELKYSLAQNVGDLFEIDSQRGIIRLKSVINKQVLINQGLTNTTGLIELRIQVQDAGIPSQTSYQKIVIKVVSSMDVHPVFSLLFYRFNVSEDAEVGKSVGEVQAVSKSSSNVLKYAFISEQSHFRLNETNGQITTVVSLNREQQRYYIFTVRVTDGLLNSGYTSVVVSVQDVNDHSPVFQFQAPYKMDVTEDAMPGTGVGVVKATDEDSGENAKITYTFVEANIGPDGAIVAVDMSCVVALGLEKGTVPASDITANSSYSESNKDFSATQGRLNNQPKVQSGTEYQGSWCAGYNDGQQFLQVDFKRLKRITKVATQGRPGGSSFVTKYELRHSLDGDTWIQHDQLLIGNSNANGIVIRRVLPAFQSRYVRLHPVSWNEQICLRVEFYGCNSDGGDVVSVPFIIDEATGIVNVSDKLDYESQKKYIILVEASDNGVPTRASSNSTLEIFILDSNDNPPIFDKNGYDVTLSENTFSGDVVVWITATDADTGNNGEVMYAIVSGSRGKFRIEASTGIIQPSSRLDYEDASERHYLLNISATDQGTPQLSAYVTVAIDIVDYNDNPPVFNASSLLAEVMENLQPGALVGTLSANDLDSGTNALIRYSFIEPSDQFSIDEMSGKVTTKQMLDREDVGNYVIKVRATDSGVSSLMTDAELRIKVIDVNDNSPVFSEKVYTRRIMEGSVINAIVVTVKAEDQDIGVNGQVVYTISSGNEKGLFKLDTVTGIITVAESLDREVNQSVQFSVVAQDQAPPFYNDESVVVVMVTDVNDNAPVIEPKEMIVVIKEDVSVGTFIVDVNATDRDSSNSDQLEYFIVHGSSGHFKIDQYNGIMRTATQLDYETTKHFTVLVMVRDTDVKGNMDFGSVEITLLDVNDNKPVFATPVGPFNVGEGFPSGTTVGVVQASDIDAERNAEITFTITAGDPGKSFAIGASSGIISTKKVLDRESVSFYNLEITSSNQRATPVLSTSITIRINIDDSNDNAPRFNASSYEGSVSENATVGEVITRVFASDPDQGNAGMISYTIINGSYSSLISIDNQTGVLTLRQSLIEGEYRNLTVIVQAKDQGNPSLATSIPVIIMVHDMNDNPPLFEKRLYSGNISEAAKVDDPVVQMTASDEDTESSASTSYELVFGNELGHFRISPDTGWVYVTRLLDRETVAQYRLGVRASNVIARRRRRRRNTVFSDTVVVEINVTDVNDNAPKFIPLSYVGGVMPGADVGTLIVSLIGTDADIGVNGELAFNITSGNKNDRFHMERDTGAIKATNIAVGSPGTLYTLKVTARDEMGNGLSTPNQATVQIYVILRNQQVVIFANVDPSLIKNNSDEFIRMLDNVTGGEAYIDKIYKVYTRDENGRKIPISEVVFHAVKNLTILSSDEIQRIVLLNQHLLETVYAKWNITKVSKIHVQDSEEDDGLTGWEIVLIVLGVIVAFVLLLFCCFFLYCRRWKRRFDEENESKKKTFFTNSPVTRQSDSLSDSTYFYSSSLGAALPFTQSQNITNPVYCAEVDSDGREEKEMELSLSDEESDQESGKRPSQKTTSFKQNFPRK